MNADAYLLVLLLMADMAFFAYLRRRHNRVMRTERMMRSLARAIRRETVQASAPPRARGTVLQDCPTVFQA